ncbi:MAG: LysM peptidoglycan-binding domain-containing protein [Treponema sp.]|nr:LysM peptidoglycan-binding domain-containing protein [Treponema sp.]
MKNGREKQIPLFFIIFFVFGLGSGWAQTYTDRPLRAVQQDFPLSGIYPRHSTYSRQTTPSLLTSGVIEQPLFLRYIAQYTSTSGKAYMNAVMERASLYLPFIKEEIKKRNLPPELAYLPVIESNFIVTARSKSGATGLWQFMLNSISPFDIKVNDIVDERRDFQKSTRGALQKLEDNYRMFGNWELALAAYNCGLGAMNRTIKKTKIRDYWELSRRKDIKQETIDYVPKFLAAAYILSNPRQFDIDCWQETYEWTAIPLKRQVSLETLSAESGADRELLQRLNAELLHGITPADKNYRLKIPTSHFEQISAVLERDDLVLVRYHYHTVRHGDTLWSMSKHYGASVDMIEQHNPGISNRYLKIGETIVIPAFKDIPPPSRPASNTRFDGQYVVKKGDTLWSLARMYGIDPQDLAQANNMTINQILREGITLKVPILE